MFQISQEVVETAVSEGSGGVLGAILIVIIAGGVFYLIAFKKKKRKTTPPGRMGRAPSGGHPPQRDESDVDPDR